MSVRRVLLVEDHPAFVKAVRTMLSHSETLQLAEVASTPEEAAEALAGTVVDFVICDVHLGDSSGIDLCERIRSHPDAPPVCMLSADIERSTVARAVTAGAVGYLHKETPGWELLRSLERAATGESVFDSRTSSALTRAATSRPIHKVPIDDIDVAILGALAEGHTQEALATRVGEDSVLTQQRITAMTEAVGATNEASLVAWALRNKIIY